MPERKTWRAAEVNLVKSASKQRQADDKLRADAWAAAREAELEAVVNKVYDGMDIPEIAALVERAIEAMAPYSAEFNRLYAQHYPAEFAKATLRASPSHLAAYRPSYATRCAAMPLGR